MSDSIRDDIEAALKEQDEREPESQDGLDTTDEQEEEEVDPEVEVPEPAKNEPETPEAAKPEEAPAAKADEPEGTWNPEKAPTSWSPKVREQWGNLPEDVRKEIVRREEASVMGVRKLQEEFQPVRQFAEHLSPFIQEARQLGADPTQYIANVMVAERQLRSQDPNDKFNALLSIADTYGIPLREFLRGEMQAPAAQPSLPPEVAHELAAMRQWREQESQQTLQRQIDEFRAGAEFFDDVRDHMAVLIETGAAKDLKEAYESAIWVNPEVREVLLQRQEAEKQKSVQNQRRARATGASVTGGDAPGVDVSVDDDDDSIEATIRKQMVASSGRI